MTKDLKGYIAQFNVILTRIDYYIFYLLLLVLPFGKKFLLPVLFGWLVFTFSSYFLLKDYSIQRFKGALLLPIIYFFGFLIDTATSMNMKGNLSDLELKLSLLLVPVLYPYNRQKYILNKANFLTTFVIGCTMASLYCILYAVYRSSSIVDGRISFNPQIGQNAGNYFLSIDFSALVHPSYFAMYLLIAFLILGSNQLNLKSKSISLYLTIGFVFLTMLVCLVLLQSRAGLLGFGLMVLFWLGYFVVVLKKYLFGLAMLLTFSMIAYLALYRFDRFSNTIDSLKKTAIEGFSKQNKNDATSNRYFIWKSAISVIKGHPIWGIGKENIKDELQKKFESQKMTSAYLMRYNAHNQYLETWLGIGIFGLLVLLVMLILPLWIGLKNKDWVLIGYACICIFSFAFESMLEVIAGIAFFAIFYTLLVGSNNIKKEVIYN